VDASEELELLDWHLLRLDTQLVVQLPLRRAFHALNCRIELGTGLAGDAQGVGAAGIGPHIGEGDLLSGALLEQKAVLRVKEENGKGTVKETLVNVGHQMACTSTINEGG
jgi:hypothetical protein